MFTAYSNAHRPYFDRTVHRQQNPEFSSLNLDTRNFYALKHSVSQLPGRGPVPGSGTNYTRSREIHLEFVTEYYKFLVITMGYVNENQRKLI